MIIGKAKPKVCKRCGVDYLPTGRCQKFCKECGRISQLEKMRERSKQFHSGGPGSGGNQRGANNNQWQGGTSLYARKKLESMAEYRCERCGADLSDVIGKSFNGKNGWWAVHHKDGNHLNPALDNLELVCKRCHQTLHECWKNFPIKG